MRCATQLVMTGWLLLASGTSAQAQDIGVEATGRALRVSIAHFDVDGSHEAVAVELVYQVSRWNVWRLRPELGAMANSEGGVLGFAGIAVPLDLPGRVRVSPSFSLGAYRRGRSLDLGRVVEFRSGIQLDRIVRGDDRVAISLYHVSNAGLGERNPGTEVLGLGYVLRW